MGWQDSPVTGLVGFEGFLGLGARLEGSMVYLGVLLVGYEDFNFLGVYMNHNKEAKSLTFWRGSEVSQGKFYQTKG